jgi:hypothetical protein
MAKIVKSGGKLDILQTPRMLTPFEIELLRKSKREMAARFKELSNG